MKIKYLQESPKKESPKSGNELFCANLVEVFDRLTRKRNQMTRIKIMQVLMKHEFANDFKGYYKIFEA